MLAYDLNYQSRLIPVVLQVINFVTLNQSNRPPFTRGIFFYNAVKVLHGNPDEMMEYFKS